MTGDPETLIWNGIRRHVRLGIALLMAVVGGVGGWAAATQISGAVIAPGQLVVDTNVKKVQHPNGGVVGEIRVRDGDTVAAGDIVVRLDDTITRANLAIVAKNLDELVARKARLGAERDSAEAVDFPPEMRARSAEATVTRIMAGETRLFELRRTARQGQADQLRQRIAQVIEEIGGQTKQATAKAAEIVLIGGELKGARDLWQRNLMPITKLTALERDATKLEGEHGALLAQIAQAKGRIAETELQIFQVGRDFSSEVAKELAEVDAKIGELIERKVAAEDQLKRVDIRAPQAGKVHQLAVHTVGGVVSAGEALMLIVPETDALSVEVRVPPAEIDQLSPGQVARSRFTAFSQRTTPEIDGIVQRVSPDVSTDTRTGASYYTVRISLSDSEIAKLGGVRLVPGMPVEAYLETPSRTVLSYLTKPLHDQLSRALREK